jgi:hypothetical protein
VVNGPATGPGSHPPAFKSDAVLFRVAGGDRRLTVVRLRRRTCIVQSSLHTPLTAATKGVESALTSNMTVNSQTDSRIASLVRNAVVNGGRHSASPWRSLRTSFALYFVAGGKHPRRRLEGNITVDCCDQRAVQAKLKESVRRKE